MGKRKTLVQKIEDKVYYCTSGCWIWTGYTSHLGRPVLTTRENGKQRIITAARISWEAFRGKIPTGMHVCHHCDNPICVNPEHLFVGTHQDNMADMVKKGRHKTPKRNGCINHAQRILNPMIVKIIREGYDFGYNMAAMARYFGIGHSTVKDVAWRKSYREIN